ncbi:MAG: hypothetical protein ABEK50_01840 [bacterium]
MSVDCIVTAMRDYEGQLTHLKVRKVRNDEAREAEAVPKADVVEDIVSNDKTYYVACPDEEDGYVLQRKLRVFESPSGSFLRIDDEAVGEDELGDLPKF